MTRIRGRGGFTLVEMMVACFLSLIVVLAMGRIIQQNVRSWRQGRDKAVLQQNVTEALEAMERSVRGSRFVVLAGGANPQWFECFNADSVLTHRYERVLVGGVGRIRDNGTDLVARMCTNFAVHPAPDGVCLTLGLELQDDAYNKVAASTRVTARNRVYEY